MGIRSRLGAAWRGLTFKEDGGNVTTSLDLFREVYGSRLSAAGVPVNWSTALQVSTVLACCRVRAEGLSVPFRLYHEADGGRKIATDNPLHLLISRKPNGWQTSLEFLETISFHLDLTYNAFVFVNRVGIAREVRELIPIEPGRVRVEQRPDYGLRYYVRSKDGQEQEFGQDAIWHLRGPSWNSWIGMDAIALARNAIGLSMALEQGQSDVQKNGLQTSGVYSVKDNLTPDKFNFLSAWMDKHLPGGERAGKPMILDMEADFKRVMMSAADQQTIETRKFQIEEICRALRVWPIMVGHAGDQSPTFASASEFFQAHKTYTLDPMYRRISQSANINLLTPDELKDGYYTKFVVNALMSSAPKDKAEYYAKMLGAGGIKGWGTQNEVRDFEDMDRSDDPEADKLPQPPVATPAPPSPPPVKADPAVIAPVINVAPPNIKLDVPASIVNVTLMPAEDGVDVTTVTKHNADGRIEEFERRKIKVKNPPTK